MRRSAGPKTGKDENAKGVSRTPFGLTDAATEDKSRLVQEEEDEEQKDGSPGGMGLKRKLSFDEVTRVWGFRSAADFCFVLAVPLPF
jgi:hypothetical protein